MVVLMLTPREIEKGGQRKVQEREGGRQSYPQGQKPSHNVRLAVTYPWASPLQPGAALALLINFAACRFLNSVS